MGNKTLEGVSERGAFPPHAGSASAIDVHGHDQRNFQPWVDDEDLMIAWEAMPLMLRAFDLQLSDGTFEVEGVSALRWTPADLFDSNLLLLRDGALERVPIFNATRASHARFGVPVPLLLSALPPSASSSSSAFALPPIFDDVEPLTGFVLRRQTALQISVLLGDFGGANCSGFDVHAHPYACVRRATLPVVSFNLTAALTSNHTDESGFFRLILVNADSAYRLYNAALYGGSIGGAFLVVAAITLILRDTCWRASRSDRGFSEFEYSEQQAAASAINHQDESSDQPNYRSFS
jgi:hypothetical protein